MTQEPTMEVILAEARKAAEEVATWPDYLRAAMRAELHSPVVRETTEPEAPLFYLP
jgi:hypothetical protein